MLVNIFFHNVANIFLPTLAEKHLAIGFLAFPRATQTAGPFPGEF